MTARRRSGPARRTAKARTGKPPTARTVRAAAPTATVENQVRGTILHLGDGRRLAFGEAAIVIEAVAEVLVARGQGLRISPALDGREAASAAPNAAEQPA